MQFDLGPADILIHVHGAALGAHPGAEISGVVADTGPAAAHLSGKPVLVPRLLPCGECALCQRGRVSVCPALRRHAQPAPQVVVPARFAVPLGPPLFPEEVAPDRLWRYAALADTLAAPHAGLVRAGQSPGELCVVLGGGFRAAAAVLVIRALGCQAAVLGPDEGERSRLSAAPFAVAAALDSAALDPEAALAALREIAGKAGLRAHGLCLLETTGTDAGRARALAMVAAGGSAVLLDRQEYGAAGRHEEDQPMPAPLQAGPALQGAAALHRICDEQGAVLGAGAAHPDLLPELVALVYRAEIPLEAFTYAVAPQEIPEVYARRRRGLDRDRSELLPIARF